MTITAINPHSWNSALGFDQAELVEGQRRTLYCSGQDAVDADGAPQHPGDLRAQLTQSIDNLEAVLKQAGMSLGEVVRLNVYATDVDAVLQEFTILNERFAGHRYATSIVGAASLPGGLLVMLEATAVA